ncbi:uncharacterized protein [Neodiprion pinetum]|uniref:uncharacterized protein n=1 Tax=Neodiprion pinetum TaxID=441929 RepID=UPI00371F7CD8
MKAEEIHTLVDECLRRLHEAGAVVHLVTCDQGPSNQKLFNSCLKVSEESPCFMSGGRNYFASFDFPHLIKRLLSTLRTHKILYWRGQIIASYEDFVKTWRYDNCSTTSNLLSHISEAHLFPSSFQAMNVKRAFQILSRRFAAAITTAGKDPHGLNTETWQASAAFAERMNKVIDSCNAYELLCRNPDKRPLADKNPEIEETLTEFVKFSSEWTIADPRRKGTAENTSQPPVMKKVPCLRGLPLTVRAILLTYTTIKEKYPGFELASGLCNQDSVEHLFSKFRQRGGHNPNPTARMVRLSLRHILSTGYIGSGSRGNVQCPDAVALIEPCTMVARAFDTPESMPADPTEHEFDEDTAEVENAVEALRQEQETEMANAETSKETKLPSYELCAINYFAGYVAQRNLRKFPCDRCRFETLKTPMEASSPNEVYTELREYEHADADAPSVSYLSRPTDKFESIVRSQLEAFYRLWKTHWACEGLLINLIDDIITDTARLYPDWFHEGDECLQHRIELLRFMVKVKVFAQTTFNNRAVGSSRTIHKLNSKLQKIKGI